MPKTTWTDTEKKYNLAVSTKKDENSVSVSTDLTIDFSGLTADDILEYAVDALVVKIQGSWRRAKNAPIPSGKHTYTATKPGTRGGVNVDALVDAKLEEFARQLGFKNLQEFKESKGIK